MHIFNVYMPCDQHIFIDDYIDVLSEIYHYCLSHNVQYLVIGGDLNTDISKINSANTIALQQFVSNECLQLTIVSHMFSVTHTFISAINSVTLIDHFILHESLFDCIMIYKQVDSIDNISDQLPVLLHLNCNIDYSIETESVFISNALWSRADETKMKIYREYLDMYLSDINVFEDLIQCADLHCDKHVSTICRLHDNILESCIKATVKAISRSKPLCKNKRRTNIPGWTDEHSIARNRS